MSRSSKSNKKLPNPKYFSILAEIEIIHLKEMMSSINLYLKGVQDDIKATAEKAKPEQYDSKHEYLSRMDSLTDELIQIKEVEDISKKLVTIGLYMIVENITKRIFKWLYYDLDERTKKKKIWILYKWDMLKKELYNLCNFDLSDVSEYSIVNELRCLNSVIKHSGYVDKCLSFFFNWQSDLGKEIDTKKN